VGGFWGLEVDKVVALKILRESRSYAIQAFLNWLR